MFGEVKKLSKGPGSLVILCCGGGGDFGGGSSSSFFWRGGFGLRISYRESVGSGGQGGKWGKGK